MQPRIDFRINSRGLLKLSFTHSAALREGGREGALCTWPFGRSLSLIKQRMEVAKKHRYSTTQHGAAD